MVERHRYDNRLATAMLSRLDRLAEANAHESTHHAARIAAQEFDAFLAALESGSPARAALFLHARAGAGEAGLAADLAPLLALARADCFLRTGAARAAEVDVADLDADRRGEWTAEQWQRAEAAGLVRFAPPPEPEPEPEDRPEAAPCDGDGNPQLPQFPSGARGWRGEDCAPDPLWTPEEEAPVWYCEEAKDWRTRFPPPPGFTGDEEGLYGLDRDYARALSAEERTVLDGHCDALVADRRTRDEEERRLWLAAPFIEEGDARPWPAGG